MSLEYVDRLIGKTVVIVTISRTCQQKPNLHSKNVLQYDIGLINTYQLAPKYLVIQCYGTHLNIFMYFRTGAVAMNYMHKMPIAKSHLAV